MCWEFGFWIPNSRGTSCLYNVIIITHYHGYITLNVTLNVTMLFLLVGFSDRFPAFGNSFGLELQSHCARPLLYETEPHQLRFQHHHHEPACGGCVGES